MGSFADPAVPGGSGGGYSTGNVIGDVIAVGQTVASIAGQKAAQKRQAEANMQLAQFQASANERYLKQQLDYDRPSAQMARYQEAGLNPHLIYGQGSPGNQSTPLQFPSIQPTEYKNLMAMLPLMNQSRLINSQVQATDAKTRQVGVMTELNRLQSRVLAANPLLNSDGFNAIIDSLKSSAEIKASESGIRKSEMFVQQASAQQQVNKIAAEVGLLDQKFNLSKLDAKIKAEVVQSKEFQNAILEVQKKFMTDGDITPQHILQFVQLLLMKML